MLGDQYGIGYKADHPTGDLADTDGGYNYRHFSDDEAERTAQRKWTEKNRGSERWKPSLFMPRWASRITLEITGVRCEHLQAITEVDAKAEGCTADDDPFWKPSYNDPDSGGNPSARNSFEYLWHQINGAVSWMQNPFVWIVEFKRL